MMIRLHTASVVLSGALIACGCASPTPRVDQHFGEAVRAARLQQTVNPSASDNTDPAAGISGAVATETMQRYRDSFKAPEPTFDIIIGTPAGSR
jgi:hypothetical protein